MSTQFNMDNDEFDNFSQTSEKTTKKSKEKKRQYYTSNGQNQIIKNAITGAEYPWRTGAFEAECLFKVVDSLGICDETGRKLKPHKLPNPSPNHCYYDSPQQFMTHSRMTLEPALIQQWEAKQALLKGQ